MDPTGVSTSGICNEEAETCFCSILHEEDFLKAMTRESCKVDGVLYRVFQWSLDFTKDLKLDMAPIWIMLPGLPPNFYHKAILNNIMTPIGAYL